MADDREFLEQKIEALEVRMDLQLKAEAREREFHQVETEQRFSAHGDRLHALEETVKDHDTRIEAQETKDTKAKAEVLDKGKAWLIGVVLAGASGWIGLNWQRILGQ